jgi:hypothetical protein
MSLTFGGALTDAIIVTSGAGIDDVTLSGGLSIIAQIVVTNATGNRNISQKSTDLFAQTSGYNFFVDSTTGNLRGGVGATSSGAWATTANTGPALNVDNLVAMTWAPSTIPKFYLNPIDVPIAETSGYTGSNTPVGATPSTDAGANLYIGNRAQADSSMKGNFGWYCQYSGQLTLAQLQRVHLGILVHRQGINEADVTKQTRGVNILKSIAGYRILLYMANNGTLTDYSGNSYTITNSGPSTTGQAAEVGNFDCPTTFQGDTEIYNPTNYRNQNDYIATSSCVRAGYTTNATAGSVWWWTSAINTPNLDLALYVGTVTGAPTVLTNTANGYNRATFSGLAGSSKVVTISNGSRTPPAAALTLPGGAYMQVIFFNATFVRVPVVPLASSNTLLCFGDSILEGGNSYPITQYAYIQQARKNPPSWFSEVGTFAYPGMQLRDMALDNTRIANTVGIITSINPKAVFIAEGFNDRGLNTAGWTAAVYQTQYIALLTAIRAAGYKGHIYVVDEIIAGATYEAANTNGDTMDAFRTAASNAASGRLAVEYVSMKAVLTLATDIDVDTIHPIIAGANKLYTNKIQPLFATTPSFISTKNKYLYWFRRLRNSYRYNDSFN